MGVVVNIVNLPPAESGCYKPVGLGREWCGVNNLSVVRQPVCDESGVGFGVAGAEKPTALWSHHSILRSDETWLPEWSGKLGGVERCAVWSRGVSWGKPVFRLFN